MSLGGMLPGSPGSRMMFGITDPAAMTDRSIDAITNAGRGGSLFGNPATSAAGPLFPGIVGPSVTPQPRPGVSTTPTPPPGMPGFSIAERPNFEVLRPDIRELLDRGMIVRDAYKTATQLAEGAIRLLNEASREVLNEAVTAVTNNQRTRNVGADRLLRYLERRVRIAEVLNELARFWDQETVDDFVEALRVDGSKRETMDAIVSIAILNSSDILEEIRGENMTAPNTTDLIDNRTIVAQWPAPGTVLEPPYLVLVAVEHRDVAAAENVVQSIVNELTDFQGMQVPSAAARKLG